MIELISTSIFVSVSLILIAVFLIIIKHVGGNERQIRNRLGDIPDGKDKKDLKAPFILKDDQLSEIPLFNRILESLKLSKKLHRLIEQAGMSIKVGPLILMSIVLGLIGFFISSNFNNYVLGILLSIFLALLPIIYIKLRRNRRLRAFSREFPDAIDMINTALKAGHAFSKAVQLVADEAPAPVCIEFRKTFEEQNLGMPLSEALFNMTRRVDSLDLKLFVTAVLLQKETGGNLTEMLGKISYTIRERFKLIGQIKVFTAQGRLSGWVVGLLPLTFLLIISAINPDYIRPLFENKTGQQMLIASFILQFIGFLIIRKIVRIKLF